MRARTHIGNCIDQEINDRNYTRREIMRKAKERAAYCADDIKKGDLFFAEIVPECAESFDDSDHWSECIYMDERGNVIDIQRVG